MPVLSILWCPFDGEHQILLRICSVFKRTMRSGPQTGSLCRLRRHILPCRDVFILKLREQVIPITLLGQLAHYGERSIRIGDGGRSNGISESGEKKSEQSFHAGVHWIGRSLWLRFKLQGLAKLGE